jgi:HK97 family phage major capsid protein
MIAQLFAQGTTNAATIRVTQEVTHTQAATAVAEEGQKPEASFDLVETDFGVKKIAVIGRVSDEMFADFPQVQAYVNSRLIYMVGSLEDNHLLNGDGTSNKITGILSTSGIQTVAAGASSTVIDAIYKALTKVSSVGFFQPDYIVVNHTDWQNIKLSKDSNGQYYAGGPFSGAYGVGGYTVAGMLWGLPVIATNAISQGTALVGAFQLGAQLFRREGIRLDTTNSDASDFQYNRIAIRVEERLALAVYRPLAFCTITGIPNV